MKFLKQINALFQHVDSQYKDERREILESLVEDDEPAWKIFTSKFSVTQPDAAPAFYLNALEKHLETAAKAVFDSNFCDEAAQAELLQFYRTVYQVCGETAEDAEKKASSLLNSRCLKNILKKL